MKGVYLAVDNGKVHGVFVECLDNIESVNLPRNPKR